MLAKKQDLTSWGYYLLSAVALLLSLSCLIFQLNSVMTRPGVPIEPTNPLTSDAQSQESESSSAAASTESQAATAETSTTKSDTHTSSSSKKESKPTTLSPINLILSAQLEQEDKNGEDTMRTYAVKERISKSSFDVAIAQISLAKLSETSMADAGHPTAGEGLLDIQLAMKNTSKEVVQIFPGEITVTVAGKEYPAILSPTFTATAVEPKKELVDSFLIVLPELAKIDAIQEFSFTWQTEIDQATQPYDITVLLK